MIYIEIVPPNYVENYNNGTEITSRKTKKTGIPRTQNTETKNSAHDTRHRVLYKDSASIKRCVFYVLTMTSVISLLERIQSLAGSQPVTI